MWPLEASTAPPSDMLYPLPSPTSPGLSSLEEAGENGHGEEGMGHGQFKRGKGMRVRKGGQRVARDSSSSDPLLHHSGSDSTLQKDGSRCSSPDSSESDTKTEDTVTTVLAERGESQPGEILSSVLSSQSGLTQKRLQELNVKKKDKSGAARLLGSESSRAREAVRRPRREETGDKGPSGSGEWL